MAHRLEFTPFQFDQLLAGDLPVRAHCAASVGSCRDVHPEEQ